MWTRAGDREKVASPHPGEVGRPQEDATAPVSLEAGAGALEAGAGAGVEYRIL